MSKQQFPPGWDESRVKNLLKHYEQMDDDTMIAEDDRGKATIRAKMGTLTAWQATTANTRRSGLLAFRFFIKKFPQTK